jgi:hypothetical protein
VPAQVAFRRPRERGTAVVVGGCKVEVVMAEGPGPETVNAKERAQWLR